MLFSIYKTELRFINRVCVFVRKKWLWPFITNWYGPFRTRAICFSQLTLGMAEVHRRHIWQGRIPHRSTEQPQTTIFLSRTREHITEQSLWKTQSTSSVLKLLEEFWCTVGQKRKRERKKHLFLFQYKLSYRNETGINHHGLLSTSVWCFNFFLRGPSTWGVST